MECLRSYEYIWGRRYKIEGEFLYNLSEDPHETTNLIPYVDHFEHTDLKLMQVVNLLRFELIAFRSTGISSALTKIPPDLLAPPSPLGCYLPLDSPHYHTVKCPVPTPNCPKNVFDKDYNITVITHDMPTHETYEEEHRARALVNTGDDNILYGNTFDA